MLCISPVKHTFKQENHLHQFLASAIAAHGTSLPVGIHRKKADVASEDNVWYLEEIGCMNLDAVNVVQLL